MARLQGEAPVDCPPGGEHRNHDLLEVLEELHEAGGGIRRPRSREPTGPRVRSGRSLHRWDRRILELCQGAADQAPQSEAQALPLPPQGDEVPPKLPRAGDGGVQPNTCAGIGDQRRSMYRQMRMIVRVTV